MPGLRDGGALESALGRPANKFHYGCDDIIELAAAYMFGLCRNHAFVDGNKRIAIVATAVFLMENGYEVETDDMTLYDFVISVASGDQEESEITHFLRSVVVKRAL
ncbi:death on curing protein [Xaviernesmea oryzae]|nr:death on curing protein [Xaviernesmea oryzae]